MFRSIIVRLLFIRISLLVLVVVVGYYDIFLVDSWTCQPTTRRYSFGTSSKRFVHKATFSDRLLLQQQQQQQLYGQSPTSLSTQTDAATDSTTTATPSTNTTDYNLMRQQFVVDESLKVERQLSFWQSIGKEILEYALTTPIWKQYLIPAARQKIVDTAYSNGILWNECYNWLYNYQPDAPWNTKHEQSTTTTDDDEEIYFATLLNCTPVTIPGWYRTVSYHAYDDGHLNWNAALESELASASIGARNIPSAGRYGERTFREQFSTALEKEGTARILDDSNSNTNSIIVDIGCATGISTRWLANRYPKYKGKIIGMDLSPYNIVVARYLQQIQPSERYQRQTDGTKNVIRGEWVSTIQRDDRIIYEWQDGTNTTFASNTVDIVNFQFVAHELPVEVTCNILAEAYRIVKPNQDGQLWFSEMDFQAPAYIAQRNNAVLFSLLRSTEPYLDNYADHIECIYQCLQYYFNEVTIVPATGRHFAIVATNKRFINDEGNENDNKLSSSVESIVTLSTTTATTTTPTSSSTTATPMSRVWNDVRFDPITGLYRQQDTHLQVWENKK